MSEFELRDVSLDLTGRSILADLTLSLPVGSCTVLMGPSGAGKSTVLRVLAGLQATTSGTVRMAGRDISTIPVHERGVAMLSQDYALYPQMTVADNLQAALKSQGLSAEVRRRRSEIVSDWFGIGELCDRLPSQISGGQAQRVAFAKALARHPKLLLLDEPFSQLDSALRQQLIQALLPACKEIGTTIVWVTHDPREAFEVADKIAVLDAGRLVQFDSPADIYAHPVSRTVADLTSYWPINWIAADSQLGHCFDIDRTKIVNEIGIRSEAIKLQFSEPDRGVSLELVVEGQRDLGFARLISGTALNSPLQVVTDRDFRFSAGASVCVALERWIGVL